MDIQTSIQNFKEIFGKKFFARIKPFPQKEV